MRRANSPSSRRTATCSDSVRSSVGEDLVYEDRRSRGAALPQPRFSRLIYCRHQQATLLVVEVGGRREPEETGLLASEVKACSRTLPCTSKQTGRYLPACDIYSFDVVMLELWTGRIQGAEFIL